jgi:tellurite methyltransferase
MAAGGSGQLKLRAPLLPSGSVSRPLWERIPSSLRRGGRFSGQLFGDRDGWAQDPALSFHRRADVEDLLQAFQLERFDEIEQNGRTALGEPKHWHVFHIVARKL